MTRAARKIYFWLILSVFFIAMPVILLYTAGYRINWETKRLVSTGSLYLKSEPRTADVYIADQLREEKTPALLNNILPDTYKIKVSKPGYLSWEKELPVESKKTVFAQNIILFKESLPELITEYPGELAESITGRLAIDFGMEAKGYAWNEKENCLQYYNDFEIWIYWQESKSKELITRQSTKINEVLWQPAGYYLIFSDDQGIKAIELDSRQQRQIYQLTSLPGTNLRIDKKGANLYFQNEGKKYRLNLY